jgi:hypothetical protein
MLSSPFLLRVSGAGRRMKIPDVGSRRQPAMRYGNIDFWPVLTGRCTAARRAELDVARQIFGVFSTRVEPV